MKTAAFVLAFVSTVAVAATASAAEKQWKLGGGLGFETLKVSRDDVLRGRSFALEADAQYGLTDMFNAFGEITLSSMKLTRDETTTPAAKDGDPPVVVPEETLPNRFLVGTAHVGIAYTLDVVRWVPYAGVGVGVTRIAYSPEGGTSQVTTRPSTLIALGLDYAWTRDLTFGAAVRLVASPGSKESWTAVQGLLRAGYTWGW